MTSPRTRSRVGRFLLDGPVSSHQHATGEVSATGLAQHGTLPTAVHFQEQFPRLADNVDEPVIPLVIPDGWSGFGRVLSAEVEPLSMTDGIQRWGVTVQPVRNPATPVIESALFGHLRDNDNGVAAAGVHGVPAGVTSYAWAVGAVSLADDVRRTDPLSPAAGNVRYRRALGTWGTTATTAQWSVPPAGYYAGGCYAETQVGPDWRPVLGRGSLPDPPSWRIGNGLVRFQVTETGLLSAEWHRPNVDAWAPTTRWQLRRTNNPLTYWTGFRSAEVTEHSAHRLTVRFVADATDGRGFVWVTIRRGIRTLHVTTDYDVNLPHPAIIPSPTTAAVDNTTYGQLATAPPSSSAFLWQYMAARDFSVVTSTGAMLPPTNVAQYVFGLSATFGGTWDSETAVMTAREWYTPISEQVVFR